MGELPRHMPKRTGRSHVLFADRIISGEMRLGNPFRAYGSSFLVALYGAIAFGGVGAGTGGLTLEALAGRNGAARSPAISTGSSRPPRRALDARGW